MCVQIHAYMVAVVMEHWSTVNITSVETLMGGNGVRERGRALCVVYAYTHT